MQVEINLLFFFAGEMILQKNLIFLLITYYQFNWCKASYSISMGEITDTTSDEPKQVEFLEEIKEWIDEIKSTPLPEFCVGTDQDFVTDNDLLVRHIPCHEKGALKK